jgi:hypothetical protein
METRLTTKHKLTHSLTAATEQTFKFFTYLPVELVVLIAEQMNPVELYTFICSSKYFYTLIMENIPHFVNLYTNVMRLDVEQFLWSMYNYEHLCINNKFIKPKETLFIKMLGVYKFAQSQILEKIWEKYNLDEDIAHHGPLPEDPTQLYIKKFQAGMLCGLDVDDPNQLYIKRFLARTFYDLDVNDSLVLPALFSYGTNGEAFKFIFKFNNKYRKASSMWCELISNDMEHLQNRGITFEMFDGYFQEALSYGASEFSIYWAIREDSFDNYLRLLKNGIEPHVATHDLDYSDESLHIYNALRYIIGNKLAHHYVLEEELNFNNDANLLTDISRIYTIGIDDPEIIDAFLDNPTDETFNNIWFQHTILGTIEIALL